MVNIMKMKNYATKLSTDNIQDRQYTFKFKLQNI